MRHKYEIRGIVLARAPLGEANALVTVLTDEVGLVRARAQGVRRQGAKLAAALATFSESSLVLVRGKEGWRVAGAVLEENWFGRLADAAARSRAARVSGLLLRLVGGDAPDPRLFGTVRNFFGALESLPEESREDAEALAVLRILAALGLDAGKLPEEEGDFTPAMLAAVRERRAEYIARINRGIAASGL